MMPQLTVTGANCYLGSLTVGKWPRLRSEGQKFLLHCRKQLKAKDESKLMKRRLTGGGFVVLKVVSRVFFPKIQKWVITWVTNIRGVGLRSLKVYF